jgi:hypothetical protein
LPDLSLYSLAFTYARGVREGETDPCIEANNYYLYPSQSTSQYHFFILPVQNLTELVSHYYTISKVTESTCSADTVSIYPLALYFYKFCLILCCKSISLSVVCLFVYEACITDNICTRLYFRKDLSNSQEAETHCFTGYCKVILQPSPTIALI